MVRIRQHISEKDDYKGCRWDIMMPYSWGLKVDDQVDLDRPS